MKLNKDDLRNKEIVLELKNGKTFSKSDLNVFKSLGLIIKWKAGQI